MIKLYLSQKAVISNQKLNAFPLLSEFYVEEKLCFQNLKNEYGNLFFITEHIEECDYIVLAHSLNFYYENNLTHKIQDFTAEVNNSGKPGWVYSGGDHGFHFRSKNVYYFRTSAYDSRLNEFDVVMPHWIKDPYSNSLLNLSFEPCSAAPSPHIGFCGQANRDSIQLLKNVVQINFHNIKSALSGHPYEKHRQYYSPLHRKIILDKFKRSKLLRCDFIERDKYRAGISSDKEGHTTTVEYFRNIYENLYTIAVRGTGNFSKRFFEVCAMGRIPIFINFDSPIPFKKELLDKGLIVELDSQMKDFDRKIVDYHNYNLTTGNFEQIQKDIRQFWKERYTKLGFYLNIHEQFKKQPIQCSA